MMRRCSEESLGRQIYITSQELRNFAERVLKPFDLTLEQFHLLKNMSPVTGLTQRELCETAGKTPANLSRMLDRMESKLLVVRRENPTDRRALLVFLTNKGRDLIEEVLDGFESLSAQLTAGISAKEQELVRKTLAKMDDNIRKMSTGSAKQPK